MINTLIKFFLENRLITFILVILLVAWGLVTAPFDWKTGLPHDPVPVDAIPDIGENQQIVFTEWPGRSPQDIEDQVTYPLTASLLGIPGVKTVRSSSIFGVSSIYLIFDEEVEFYWSRSRVLEKLNSLPKNLLPEDVQPRLGPDATALGQIFWYTIEGRDEEGNPAGGWDPQEIRTVQDFTVRYALAAAEGVSEVASVGGFVKEYQIDIDPAAMEGYGLSLAEISRAVQESNRDIGAKTLEINQAEYLVRGLGYVKSLEDLEQSVVKTVNNTPVRIGDVARVSFGPASRRGALDKSGAEAVGGVVVARYGANPLEVIDHVKAKIEQISDGLPARYLEDGTLSKLTIVPFYDRTRLIRETIGTLEEALSMEVIITIIVVLVMLFNLRASLLVSSLLPIAVLICFIAMKYLGVSANVVALSGIAIAIGTMVDVGIVLTENITRHRRIYQKRPLIDLILEASKEVTPAIITAVMTTIISFIPVFTLEAAEGKLFRPLAYTKTFALVATILVALIILPCLAYWIYGIRLKSKWMKIILNAALIVFGVCILVSGYAWAGWVCLWIGLLHVAKAFQPQWKEKLQFAQLGILLIAISWLLGCEWLPLGVEVSGFSNFLFVALIMGFTLGLFTLFIRCYPLVLNWCLNNRIRFLAIPTFILLLGSVIWLGFDRTLGFVPAVFGEGVKEQPFYSKMMNRFPGIGREFMPALNEGAFLLMPTSMPHAGIDQNREVLRLLDMAVTAIPEVESVVGKLGRTESALDPAPISMYENLINYKSEFKTDKQGRRMRFKKVNGEFVRNESGELIPDRNGDYYRQWREEIRSPEDIWNEISRVTQLPGVTAAPKLQPIETRLVMLQTGMRAPMGIKVKGPDLATIQAFGIRLEALLKEVPSVKAEAVFAERTVGKPYLLIDLNRHALARYGLTVSQLQDYIRVAVGGTPLSSTVEGRERYPIRVRYPRELRNDPEALGNILIPTPGNGNVPLGEFANITYSRGPQMIKSEDTFLTGYVIFDKARGKSEVEVVEAVQAYIERQIASGQLSIPAGVSYEFAGNYQNQVRAESRLSLVIPIVLIIVFLVLYIQFRSVAVSMMVFSGVAVAFGGGFIMLWLYGQEGFLNFSLLGTHIGTLFNVSPVNLSVAVWVGFIALFGIATDDGVLMATYLDQSFGKRVPADKIQIRQLIIEAGKKRIRPCLMTTATTLLALLPILTSKGRGSDIMIPMAIPAFGGMLIALITLFVVPVLYSFYKEAQLKKLMNTKPMA